MCVGLLAGLLPLVLTFKGGSEYDLCKVVEATVHRPVVIMCDPGRQFGATTIKYEDEKDLRRLLDLKLKLDSVQPAWGFAAGGWPRAYFSRQNLQSQYVDRFPVSEPLQPKFHGELVQSFDSGSTPVSVVEALQLLGAEPEYCHPFYLEARLSVVAHDCSKLDLVRTLASAVGAGFVKTATGIRLEFSPRVMRERVLRMSRRGPDRKNPQLRAMETADLDYLSTLFQYLSDSQITAVYTEGERSVRFERGHPVHTAAMRRAMSRIEHMRTTQALRVASDLPQRLKEIDPDGPVICEVRPDGALSCLYSIGPHNWIGF